MAAFVLWVLHAVAVVVCGVVAVVVVLQAGKQRPGKTPRSWSSRRRCHSHLGNRSEGPESIRQKMWLTNLLNRIGINVLFKKSIIFSRTWYRRKEWIYGTLINSEMLHYISNIRFVSIQHPQGYNKPYKQINNLVNCYGSPRFMFSQNTSTKIPIH